MNLILLSAEDFTAPDLAVLKGRRLRHVLDIHRAKEGDELCTGVMNGMIGTGRILGINSDALEIKVMLNNNPPEPLPATVVIALPRPKVMRRVLYTLTVLGVKRIVFVNAARVEKSYWQSPFLEREAIQRQVILGLEQARDTVLPEVFFRPRFKPFVQDELPAIAKETTALVAHPYAEASCPCNVSGRVTLAIGPEGGFVPFEIEELKAAGFSVVRLGKRIMNVETAVPSLLSKLL